MSRFTALAAATAAALGVAGSPGYASVVTVRSHSFAEPAPDLFLPPPPRHHGWPGRGHGTRSRRSARLRHGSRARRHASKRANRRPS